MDDFTKLSNDLAEIKSALLELIKQGAVHNQILAEHEKRSTSLEDRFGPIEDDFKFYRKLLVVGGGVIGVLTFLIKAIEVLPILRGQ